MNNSVLLKWDTNFFGFKVGKITFSDESYLRDTLNEMYNEQIKLVYGFSKIEIKQEIIKKYNGILIDKKIIFYKTIDSIINVESEIATLNNYNTIDYQNLLSLTFESGHFSRYKRDLRLPDNTFKRLYKVWLDNSLAHKIADKIFIFRRKNIIEAFVTIKIKNKIGEIGLIAVSSTLRGKNIGSALLKQSENYCFSEGITRVVVSTQEINQLACNFYLKNKYKIKEKINIYHFINDSI